MTDGLRRGWDQTGSNGANLSFPDAFGIGAKKGEPNFERDRWIVGVVNAAPYIASSCLCVFQCIPLARLDADFCLCSGCWLSDPLNHYFGRRGTIFFSAIFCFLSVIGSAFTQTWEQLFVTRLLLGVGMG